MLIENLNRWTALLINTSADEHEYKGMFWDGAMRDAEWHCCPAFSSIFRQSENSHHVISTKFRIT